MTKKPDNKSPKPIQTFYKELPKFAEVKRNSLLHSRMLIIDDKEVLITTSDFTVHSLTQNYEIGYWTNEASIVSDTKSFFRKMWEHEDTKDVGKDMKTINGKGKRG